MWVKWKGQGQIQGQIRKIVQKRQIVLLSFVISPKFTKIWRGIIYQSKLQCIGFVYLKKKLNMLCFHGDIQDGV